MDEPESKPKQARDEKGRLLPGHSGNPGGRPVGIAGVRKLIREKGEVILEQHLKIATGEAGADFKDQLRAIELAYSYWLGKPQQQVKIDLGNDTAEVMRSAIDRMRADPKTNAAIITLAEASSTTLPKKAD